MAYLKCCLSLCCLFHVFIIARLIYFLRHAIKDIHVEKLEKYQETLHQFFANQKTNKSLPLFVYIRVNVFESDYIKIKFAWITFIDISTRKLTSCFTLKALTRIFIIHIKNDIFNAFYIKMSNGYFNLKNISCT